MSTNRRARRAANARARKAWAVRIIGFDRAAQGVIAQLVIRRDTVLALMLGRDPRLLGIMRTVEYLLAKSQNPGDDPPPLCLACDHIFTGDYPDAVVVTIPYAGDPSYAMVTGVCPACAQRDDDDLIAVARASLRQIWPSLRGLPRAGGVQ